MYFCWLTRRTSVLYWINCAYLPWDLKYKCKKTNRIANRIAMNFDMSRTCWTGTYYDWCWFNVAQINCCCIERCIELNVTLLAYMDRRWKQFFASSALKTSTGNLTHDTEESCATIQDFLPRSAKTSLMWRCQLSSSLSPFFYQTRVLFRTHQILPREQTMYTSCIDKTKTKPIKKSPKKPRVVWKCVNENWLNVRMNECEVK